MLRTTEKIVIIMLPPLLAQTLPHNVLYFHTNLQLHVTCSGMGSRHAADFV